LKEKAVEKQFVRDHIKSDLAVLSCCLITLICGCIVGREIVGPFDAAVIDLVFWIVQCVMDGVLVNRLRFFLLSQLFPDHTSAMRFVVDFSMPVSKNIKYVY
jgi:hypothetical protein